MTSSRESYSTARHSLGLYRCVATTCRYCLPPTLSSQDPDALKAVLYPALAKVVVREPFLRVGIIDEDTAKPCFVQVPAIDLNNQVAFATIPAKTAAEFDELLARRLEDQHDILWPELAVRPPWKVVVIPRPNFDGEAAAIEVLFAHHHAIGDGTSGKIFHAKLLAALNTGSTEAAQAPLQGDVIQSTEPPTLPEPQEKIVPFTISIPFLLTTLWNEICPTWFQSKPSAIPWHGSDIDIHKPYRTNIRLVTISAPATARILAACRSNSTTLTPLLNALILASLARRLPAALAPRFAIQTPIALRPYVSPSANFNAKDSFHVLVTATGHEAGADLCAAIRKKADGASGADADADADAPAGSGTGSGSPNDRDDGGSTNGDALLWDFATDMRQTLKHKTDDLPADDLMGLLAWVGDWHAWLRKRHGRPREWSWELSNVGVLDGGIGDGSSEGVAETTEEGVEQTQEAAAAAAGPWSIARGVFTQSAMVVGPAVGVSVFGVVGGPVTISLSWLDGGVEAPLMDGLATDLAEWTRRFGDEGVFGIVEM